MVQVYIHLDDMEQALKRLKKLIGKDGILTEVRRKAAVHKPSDRRKLKDSEARRRQRNRKNGKGCR